MSQVILIRLLYLRSFGKTVKLLLLRLGSLPYTCKSRVGNRSALLQVLDAARQE